MRVPPVPLNPAERGDDRLCPGRPRPVPEALTPRRKYGRLPGRGHLTPVIAGRLSRGPRSYRDRPRREKRPPEQTWLTAAGRPRRWSQPLPRPLPRALPLPFPLLPGAAVVTGAAVVSGAVAVPPWASPPCSWAGAGVGVGTGTGATAGVMVTTCPRESRPTGSTPSTAPAGASAVSVGCTCTDRPRLVSAASTSATGRPR